MQAQTRRCFMQACAAVVAATRADDAQAQAERTVRIVATGLKAPESPKPLPDGSVLVVEMARGTLTRILPDGTLKVVADLGGTPNGVAMGPDGAAFVCNSGGLIFKPVGDLMVFSGNKPDAAGLIQKVDLKTGKFDTLYSDADNQKLQGPNDAVFDGGGGFWFTAARMPHPSGSDRGAVYWATADGKTIRRVAWVTGCNGIALSPDGNTLYVIGAGKVHAFAVTGAGELAKGADNEASERVLFDSAGAFGMDSMCADAGGNLVIGALQKGDVASLPREGFIAVVSSQGALVDKVAMPDRFVTNIGFGGPDFSTAYATLTTTGRLAAVRWPRPGLKLNASVSR
jgi:gluconolactonase